MKAIGIILAGGSGSRFEADVPKQFCMLNGRLVVEHSVETFRASGLFDKIIVVLPSEWINHPRAAIGDVNILGGRNRNESTWNALQRCDEDTDIVLIHDAARPFVTTAMLQECVAELALHDAVDVCIPADDTIVQVDAEGIIEHIPDRRTLMRGQTPQGFRFTKIRDAYVANLDRLNATDDVGIFLRTGGRCRVVGGSPFNLKLTYPHDLFVAERILQYRTTERMPRGTSLQGKRILLLGGSGGIGSCIKGLLVARGAQVSAPTRAELDLANLPIPDRFAEAWDCIIHAAGVLSAANDARSVDAMFAVNFRSVVAVTDLARKAMKGGSIVVLGSSSAMKGRPGFPLYSASKAAVNNFVEGIAPVLSRECSVRINCINPSCVRTPMTAGALVTNPDPLAPIDVAEIVLEYVDPLDTGQIANQRKYVPYRVVGSAA